MIPWIDRITAPWRPKIQTKASRAHSLISLHSTSQPVWSPQNYDVYRDPVGIWTIGYGHTSRAGLPIVSAGMVISKQQGQQILMRDVSKFAKQIRPLIRVHLNDNQFSALVSFAYNVGVGGFKRSSVLKRVNEKRFDEVPHRLALWIKAGGRPLRGLVRRRAAEGELFLATSKIRHPKPQTNVEPVKGKSFEKSTTNFAAILSAIAGLFSSISTGLSGNLNSLAMIFLMVVIVLGTAWVVRERWLKSQIEGV